MQIIVARNLADPHLSGLLLPHPGDADDAGTDYGEGGHEYGEKEIQQGSDEEYL